MMIDDLLLVHIASLEAALTKLDIKIPIKDLLKAIHDEDEAKLGVLNWLLKRTNTASRRLNVGQSRLLALVRSLTILTVALQPPEVGFNLTPIPQSYQTRQPGNADPLAKERQPSWAVLKAL